MKVTGIVRRVDELGRIVIPKEIRRTSHIREGDPLEIYLYEDGIVLKPYEVCSTYKDQVKCLADRIKEDYALDTNQRVRILQAIRNLQSELDGGYENGMA